MKTHVVGVIPARYPSTRLPGKPLLHLAGKPLIQWVWEAASQCSSINELLIATDDERIVAVCTGFGAEAVMTSAACPSGSDRIAEALHGKAGDVIVNLQGDEPLMDPATVDRCVEALLEDNDADVCTAMTVIHNRNDFVNPNVVKVVTAATGHAMYFSRAPIPDNSRDTIEDQQRLRAMKHLGLYVYRRQALEHFVQLDPSPYEKLERLEQLRFLEAGMRIRMVEVDEQGIGVDTPEDAVRAEELLAARAGLPK